MGPRRVELGPTAETVRHNIQRIRKAQGLTLRDVAERLAQTDRRMAHNTVSEIENGGRRVDVDDLVTLALALNTTPNALLLPPTEDPTHQSRITCAGWQPAASVWKWARGERVIPLGKLPPGGIERATAQLQLNSVPALQDISGAPNIDSGPIQG
ncbi:helix-turn-helix transcriptional regulator [Nocardia puris]|uniref:helix-turn-helix domain-containing protein n=1 Tax=Nocardia puris TaxID=208602 RepID=UPI001894A6B0|nr:helix-turn-helix transcriptional regulator [Nocardia puris]MBF6213818.1 helix-turn-helix transcriptional regulator [Nocardia puris]